MDWHCENKCGHNAAISVQGSGRGGDASSHGERGGVRRRQPITGLNVWTKTFTLAGNLEFDLIAHHSIVGGTYKLHSWPTTDLLGVSRLLTTKPPCTYCLMTNKPHEYQGSLFLMVGFHIMIVTLK